MTKKLLCIDGYNFIHRARAGFLGSKFSIVYNFMRNLRALVEQHQADEIYFVLEGHPRARHSLVDNYKANRIIDPISQPKKHEVMVDFHAQKEVIINLVKGTLPMIVCHHPWHECDDVIYNLILHEKRDVNWVVVSNDTDFIQLLQQFDNVDLYNPMKKKFLSPPDYDYITFKALRGDASDNIAGIKGVGNKRAAALASDLDHLSDRLKNDKNMREIYLRNCELIKFITWNDEDLQLLTKTKPLQKNWAELSDCFTKMGFKSILKEKTWQKFINTFEPFWD